MANTGTSNSMYKSGHGALPLYFKSESGESAPPLHLKVMRKSHYERAILSPTYFREHFFENRQFAAVKHSLKIRKSCVL